MRCSRGARQRAGLGSGHGGLELVAAAIHRSVSRPQDSSDSEHRSERIASGSRCQSGFSETPSRVIARRTSGGSTRVRASGRKYESSHS
jgi:hypothetical protein